ncbi:MAG TPA: hypothetical protein ENN77_02490, partial [Candidatus Wirthbacteria bacterium]|nr:hypothetical protein [Candidatus Wirthbacteria bacterium]
MISPQLTQILRNIDNSKKILILTHQDPDADAFGSTRAISYSLQLISKKTTLIYVYYHRPLRTFKPEETVLSADHPNAKKKLATLLKQDQLVLHYLNPAGDELSISGDIFDYALILDTNYSDHSITGLIFESEPKKGVGSIDHHVRSHPIKNPDQDYNQPRKSSASEIVYQIIPQILNLHKKYSLPLDLSYLKQLLNTQK